MLFLNYCIFSGSAEALVKCGGKLQHLPIAYFLGNTLCVIGVGTSPSGGEGEGVRKEKLNSTNIVVNFTTY